MSDHQRPLELDVGMSSDETLLILSDMLQRLPKRVTTIE